MSLMDELLWMEKELWEGGPEAYRRLLDDDCLIAFTDMSRIASREEIAGTVEESPRWRDVQIEVEGLLRPKGTVAILTYRAWARREDGEHYRALVSSGYVDRAGEWKMMFHQQTPLPT